MKKKSWHGMNWIRKEKRERIYKRDGYACVWCGWTDDCSRADKFTLDHLIPRSCGGSNHENNLVTCCKTCNDRRADMTLRDWVAGLAVRVNLLGMPAFREGPILYALLNVIDSGRKGGKPHGLRKSA